MEKLKEIMIPFIKKYSVIIISVLLLLILLCLGYLVGNINKGRDKVINNLEMALKDDDVNKLRNVVRVNNKKVSSEELKPLMDYFSNNISKIENTIRSLKTTDSSNEFTLEKTKGLFKDKYKININLVNLTITSNFNEGEFTLNNTNKLIDGDTFSDIIPGSYTIKGVLQSEYGDIVDTKDIVISENKKETFTFNAININVESDYEEAEIFINDVNTGYKVLDNKEIGPIISDGSVNVHLEKDFPWGRINSGNVAIKDINKLKINIDMNNEELQTSLNIIVKSFYESVFNSLNEEDKDLISDATEETKNKIYTIIEKEYFILKNKYTISNINIDNDKSEFSYSNGMYKANIVVNLDYNISKTFLGLNKTSSEKSFFTKLVYKNNSWMVEDVENFNL